MHDFTIVTDSATPKSVSAFDISEAIKHGMTFENANKMGFSADLESVKSLMACDSTYKKFVEGIAQDAGFNLGDADIDALGQFFLVWNDTEINALYRGRTAVQTFGVKTMGDWTTEKVAFKLRELTAPKAGFYDDFSRPASTGYNYGYDVRDTLRLEWGIEVTKLEEAVAGVMRRNAYKDKKDALVLAQDIWLNNFFWKGVSFKKLYGVLNEPNLVARGTTNMSYDFTDSNLTVDQVCAQLRLMKQKMATDLKGNGDIDALDIKICCPIKYQTAFTIQNSYNGYTAYKWLAENWKNAKVEFKPELDDADDDGSGLIIVFARNVPGVGLDSINLSQTSKLRLVGAMPTLKGREEAYSASIAGALCACPLAVQLWAGIDDSSN